MATKKYQVLAKYIKNDTKGMRYERGATVTAKDIPASVLKLLADADPPRVSLLVDEDEEVGDNGKSGKE